MRKVLPVCVAVVVVLGAVRAEADDDPAAPVRPLSLPVLAHAHAEARTSTLLGSVAPNFASERTSALVIERFRIEAPANRWLYLGGGWAMTGALPPGGATGQKLLGGNVEVDARAIWTAPSDGIAMGLALGLLLPTADHGSSAAQSVALAAGSANVAEYNMFRTMKLGLRPAVDARVTTGVGSFQARQALEYAHDPATFQASRVSTVSSLFVGVALADAVTVGTEVSELYLLDAKIPDGRRASLTAEVGASWSLGRVVPAVGFFSTVGSPLSGEIDRVYGGRLSVAWIWAAGRGHR